MKIKYFPGNLLENSLLEYQEGDEWITLRGSLESFDVVRMGVGWIGLRIVSRNSGF
jgi:hypothetical protein